jgi:hypothetical protein
MKNFLLLLLICAAAPAPGADFSRVAVVAFAEGEEQALAARSVQTRLESILIDNGVEVLDRDKTDELTNVWQQLEDPGYFVTAEDFVEKAEQYAIDGVVRVYISTDVAEGIANYFTATAQADIRFVAEDARVTAITTPSMGIRGNPPSDGLTARAAVINAVQRAADRAAAEAGLELLESAVPRSVQLELVAAPAPSAMTPVNANAQRGGVANYADMAQESWRTSEVTCETVSPDGNMGAAGAYIREGMRERLYGSTLHVVDFEVGREILAFDTAEIERRERWEKGPAKIHDCSFIGSWRYLTAVTGNHIFLWDTERGLELSKIHIEDGLKKGALTVGRSATGAYMIAIKAGRDTFYYAIQRKT